MSQHIYTYDPSSDQLNEIGGAGHIIKDESGTSFTKRENLQFNGMTVTDDATSNSTIVDPIETNFVGTWEEWEALTLAERAQYETVDLLDDFNGAPIDPTPTKDSINPVQSGGVYDALDPMLNVLGAKNLLPNNATSQTVDGVTFTVNSDGSVTANGTATKPSGATTSGLSFYIVSSTNPYTLKKGTYKLTGWIDEVSDNVNFSIANRNTYTNICTVSSDSPEQTFTLSDDTSVYVVLWMKWGTTINKTFYPMIRPASIADDTYVPHAMTNRELTEKSPTILYTSTGDAGLKSLDIDLSEWAIVLLMIRFASTKCNSPVILIPGKSFTVGTPTELNNGEVVNERYCAYGHSSTSNITIDEIGYFSSANNWNSRLTGTLAVNYGLFEVIGLIRR